MDKMENEITETDKRMNELIEENNGQAYEGTNYVQSEQDQLQKGEVFHDKHTIDIFDCYGFGITSWFILLRKLIQVYSILSVLAIGLMMTYASGNQLSGPYHKAVAKYSLGNLGFSESNCLFTYIGMTGKEQELKCSRGNIRA